MNDAVSPSRRSWVFGGMALLALAAGAGGAWWRHRSQASDSVNRPGDDFWSQRVERPEGGELILQSLQGRPLLLNFWATWCTPCIEEMPMLDGFFRENSPNGWQVVGLAIDQPASIRKYLQRTPVSYPIGMLGGEGTALMRRVGNTMGGLPFTLVLDAGGVVAARKMGKVIATDLQAWRLAGLRG